MYLYCKDCNIEIKYFIDEACPKCKGTNIGLNHQGSDNDWLNWWFQTARHEIRKFRNSLRKKK